MDERVGIVIISSASVYVFASVSVLHVCAYMCLCVHERMCVCMSVHVYMHIVAQEYVYVVLVGSLVCGLPLCQCTPQSVSSLGTTYYFSRF